MKRAFLLVSFVLSSLFVTGLRSYGQCNSPNEISDGKGLPVELSEANKLWEIELGSHQYSIPTVDGGKIFIGINDSGLSHPILKETGGGIVMCLDEATGEMIWQLVLPRFRKELHKPHYFNQWQCGVCSGAVVEGDRIYLVGSRGDVLCLDRNGQANGNDGPFMDEAQYMGVPKESEVQLTASDGDIIWRYDMITKLRIYPHDVCGSTVLVHGDMLYVCTSNGVDSTHEHVTNELAPSLIVLDKRTGRLIAKDDEKIGTRLFHGQWSSPAAGQVNGKTLIFFGDGVGILHAFEPPSASAEGQVQILKKAWSHDCNPPEYRIRDGKVLPYSLSWRKTPEGPSEIISTPIFYDNRVYVAIGQSPYHGRGGGMLSCIDAASGDEIWSSKLVDRSLSTVCIVEGLLYISDFTGNLHCFDADTGKRYWVHDLGSGVWCASPLVANGKIYIGTEGRDFWVLKAGKEKQVLSESLLESIAITAVTANSVLYIPTQRKLCAYRKAPIATGDHLTKGR